MAPSDNQHPGALMRYVTYSPLAAPTSLSLGNGLNVSYGYNSRAFLTSQNVGNVYGLNVSYAPNGNIQQANDTASEPALSSSMLSQNGLNGYTPANAFDGDVNTHAWHTDSAAPPNTYLQLDLGAGNAKSFVEARIYASTDGYAGDYSVQYSDDASTWNNAATGFIPSVAGWNSKSWTSVGAHRYWRLYLTNTPGPGSWLNELQFQVNGSWNYTYDDFNRLLTAENGVAGFSYDYDRFGNRWHQNVTKGSITTPSYSFDGNNRIEQGTVDAAGNVTTDPANPGHTLTYDAEGRLIQVDGGSTASYLYDAAGRRFRSTVGSTVRDYVYDLNGRVMFEVNPGTTWTRGEVYAGGTHVATLTGASGTTVFSHSDWLGTERVRTDVSGGIVQSCTNYPFGDGQQCTATDPSPTHFTGLERDGETGLDRTWFRKYSPTQGRWLTPDPAGLAAVDLSNPQSLNRYAYVLNSPLNLIDPLGLDDTYFFSGGCIIHGHSYAEAQTDADGNISTTVNWTYDVVLCSGGGGGGGGGGWGGDSGGAGGGGGIPAAKHNNWAWNFTTSFFGDFSLSTTPGTCLGAFVDEATAPLKNVRSAVEKYTPVAVAILQAGPAGAAAYVQQINRMIVAGAADVSEAAPVVGTVSALGSLAAQAAPLVKTALPYGTTTAVDTILLNALVQEVKAGRNGQCTW